MIRRPVRGSVRSPGRSPLARITSAIAGGGGPQYNAWTLDATTLAEYNAAGTSNAKAGVIVTAFGATPVVTVYDGSNVSRGNGTLAGPLTSTGAVVTVGAFNASLFTVTFGGGPDATWYLEIKNGTRTARGSFGLPGSGKLATWSEPTFTTGQKGQFGTFTLTAQGISGSAPVNTAVPTISGTPQVGNPLSSSPGTWTQSPTSYARQWQISADGSTGWADIAGATGTNYTPISGDLTKYLRLQVSATNAFGTSAAPAFSAVAGPVAAAGGVSADFTATVNGSAVTAAYIDTITTASGQWYLFDLGSSGDMRVYAWRLNGNASWVRAMVTRRHFTLEASDSTALSMASITVALTVSGTTSTFAMQVAQGSIRIAENAAPVAPNAAWIRAAVAAKRVPAYRRERVWPYGGISVANLAVDPLRGAYDPTSLGPIPGSAGTPTDASNYVGTTNGSGGESAASRGFLHNIDAQVIDAALHTEDSTIASTWSQVVQYTYYSLAQPQGAAWSTVNHVTTDPQIPMAGDAGWSLQAGSNVRSDIDSLAEVTSWTRDVAHLENTAFAHWIATEDPVAGICIQRQLGFALAAYYEYRRPGTMTTYRCYDEKERGFYNVLSALWKGNDVATRAGSVNGKVLWNSTRTAKMIADCVSYFDTTRVQPILAATAGTSYDWIAKVTQCLTVWPLSGLFANTVVTVGNVPKSMTCRSTFMLVQYGKEPLWLFSKAGNTTVQSWLAGEAAHMDGRLRLIGGSAGVDGTPFENVANPAAATGVTQIASTGGSGYPLSESGVTPSYSTLAGWATWVKSLVTTPNTTNFTSAQPHTAIQSEGMILFAQDVGVSGMAATIAAIDAAKPGTTGYTFPGVLQTKHLGGPT